MSRIPLVHRWIVLLGLFASGCGISGEEGTAKFTVGDFWQPGVPIAVGARFAVSANQVAVTELGSSNGTWLRHGQGVWIRLPPGEPMPMQARDQLRIADPWAMVVTLEPVVR